MQQAGLCESGDSAAYVRQLGKERARAHARICATKYIVGRAHT